MKLTMTAHPCAKINLGLNIVSKRADGYHDLQTVFYPVRLFDDIVITANTLDKQECLCNLIIDGIDVIGATQDNLVVKAYNALASRFKLPDVSIKLTKRIPTQAGMGGGSADCAFTLTTLNNMFNLGLSIEELRVVAAGIGADCAFFINPIPSYAEGIGERLIPIHVDLNQYKLVIVKPKVSISTCEAFAKIVPKYPETCCRDVVRLPVKEWKDVLINDFEHGVICRYPIIGHIKQTLYDMGATYAAMSGSGSALFGLFQEAPNGLDETFKGCFTSIIELP